MSCYTGTWCTCRTCVNRRSPCFVYFIQEGTDGPIKIGSGWRPDRRLVGLQVGNPRELRLLGFTPGRSADERRWHQRFASTRVRGEWFSPSVELLAAIAGLADPATAPGVTSGGGVSWA